MGRSSLDESVLFPERTEGPQLPWSSEFAVPEPGEEHRLAVSGLWTEGQEEDTGGQAEAGAQPRGGMGSALAPAGRPHRSPGPSGLEPNYSLLPTSVLLV